MIAISLDVLVVMVDQFYCVVLMVFSCYKYLMYNILYAYCIGVIALMQCYYCFRCCYAISLYFANIAVKLPERRFAHPNVGTFVYIINQTQALNNSLNF